MTEWAAWSTGTTRRHRSRTASSRPAASWPPTTPAGCCCSGAAIPASGRSRWASRSSARLPSQCAIRETLEETGVLTELTGILGVYSDPAHIVAYGDGEIRQEWELIFLGRPVSGMPTVNDEASDVRWVVSGDLESLDIHPTQWLRSSQRPACSALLHVRSLNMGRPGAARPSCRTGCPGHSRRTGAGWPGRCSSRACTSRCTPARGSVRGAGSTARTLRPRRG
jgi:8-oxo-dGTP pyrophosphatase MutT (NUDIX family)